MTSCAPSRARDPALPGLERVLALPGARVVRHRSGRRCTIRVGADRFVKLYPDEAAEHAHADGLQLWQAAQRGELAFRVARPDGFDPELRAVWQRRVAGAPARDGVRAPTGEELAARLGIAAGTLPGASLRPRRLRDRRSELARSRRRAGELVRRVPELHAPARRLLDALATRLLFLAAAEPRPVHGALHVSQWLDTGAHVALLDYDSLALGDPELDAATFLADIDVENRDRIPVDRLCAAFIAGYEDAAGQLDPQLLAFYRAQRRLEKALRVARARRPDGDRKARRRLRLALECLGEPA
jgi:hypothetical protein